MSRDFGRVPSHTAYQVAGVLLAAGLGSRLGQPKPLALLGGEALCRYAARAMAGANYAALLAVIAPGEVGLQVRAALAEWPFEFVVNPEPRRGMLSSFQVALQVLQHTKPPLTAHSFAAANFALADMPRLTSAVHQAALDTFARSRPPLVLAQYGAGRDAVQAPPHLFRADLWPEIQRLPASDHGPRALVKKYAPHAETLHFVAELLLDIDTPAALAAAQQGFVPAK